MGSFEGPSDSALPQHRVTIPYEVAVAKHEVTRGQFAAFIKESGYAPSSTKNCTALLVRDVGWSDADAARNWRDPGFEQSDDHPVVCVSWDDAKAYVAWLAKKTGKNYRLLSESEWEYAARAGSRRTRYWGDDFREACRFANIWDETFLEKRGIPPQAPRGVSFRALKADARPWDEFVDLMNRPRTGPWYLITHWCTDSFSFTSPVGRFAANEFGLHDMIGNAMEWIEDCLHLNYQGAPTDGSAWTQGECAHHVIRGGSWASIPEDAQSASRFFRQQDFRASDLGFRVARSP